MKKTVIIVLGIGAVGGIAWYLYNKNKNAQGAAQAALLPSDPGSSTLPAGYPSAATPSPGSPASSVIKQKMWKDKDGNLFEMTSDKQKWGYTIKVNGGVQKKSNQMVVMVLAPDGYMIGADNNGSVYQYKNGGWNYVVKDDKNKADQFLRPLGVTDYLSLNGFGGFRGLAGFDLGNAAYLLT